MTETAGGLVYKVIECLIFDHDHWMVLTAALVCICGSGLTMLLTRRMVRASGRRKFVQVALTSMIGGATIWSTHFIAMLAFDPGYPHAYEPIKTAASLLIAVGGLVLTNWTLAYAVHPRRAMMSGAMFGLTVSLMHYVGMLAYLVPGDLVWNLPRLAASVAIGAGLGVIAYWRVAKPLRQMGWLSSSLLMVLAICGMHFTGMSALEIVLNPLVAVPVSVIADTQLSTVILAVMAVILLVGFASFSIEMSLEGEALRQRQQSALVDGLTMLPNRSHLENALSDLQRLLAQDPEMHLTVVTLDLEQFKKVNATYGNATGDAVLKTVAERLLTLTQAHQFVARTGGNEFVALCIESTGKGDTAGFVERLRAAVERPMAVRDVWISLTTAIGVATTRDNGREVDALLLNSGVAMRVAKSDPDQPIAFFDPTMEQDQRALDLLGQDLHRALDREEFSLVFQRQNELASLEVTGFEALLRWTHPTQGPISPGVFIPLAESNGLIHRIGMWVLRAACQEAASWPRDLTIAVNVAPQQLIQPDFVDEVGAVLEATGLPSTRLELEITEASVIGDQAHTLRVIGRLRAMGIRIAMDDFGTGYSSLSMLQTIPFDKIKVDRSFITQVHNNPLRAAIVRSTLLIGTALKIPVLAEGVEDPEELAFLRAEGCDAVQGFYFGKPVGLDDVRAIVQADELRVAS